VIACDHENNISIAHNEEDSLLQTGAALKEPANGSDTDARVFVRSSKTFFQPRKSVINGGLLLRCEVFVRAVKRWTFEDHFFQGLSLPALRS